MLTNYEGKCCITGLPEERLLVASHIVPWSVDKGNRLNPHNGLCLSALHDRAFDAGLITIQPNMQVQVSRELQALIDDEFARISLIQTHGRKIVSAVKFHPDPEFLDYHRREIFLG